MEKPVDQSVEGFDHVSYVNPMVDTPAEEDTPPHLHSKTFLIVLVGGPFYDHTQDVS